MNFRLWIMRHDGLRLICPGLDYLKGRDPQEVLENFLARVDEIDTSGWIAIPGAGDTLALEIMKVDSGNKRLALFRVQEIPRTLPLFSGEHIM